MPLVMIFRQLFDRESCTYTYLLGDEETREAVLIDPVREHVDRDIEILQELGLTLKYTLETHVHADHITAAGTLRARLGCQTVLGSEGGAPCVDIKVDQGDSLEFGPHRIDVLTTPGHTGCSVSYYVADRAMIFTGDALFVRGCGRTDFQGGDARTLYRSIHDKVFTLADATTIYPGHDYKGRTCTTVAEERQFNPRLGGGKTIDEFVAIMEGLNLAQPTKIDVAVPANQNCGLLVNEQVRAWSPVIRSGEGVPELPAAWVAAHLDQYRLIDVREPEEATGAVGRVEGADLVPLGTLEGAAAQWDRSAPLVVYCHSGKRSADAAQRLEAMGFMRVASMTGGMLAWNASSLPVGD